MRTVLSGAVALAALALAPGVRADETESSTVNSRWQTTVYGVLKTDAAYDTTQSFTDLAGAGLVARPGGRPLPPPASPSTYAGDHGRTQFSLRDSRFGLRVRAPDTARVSPSALLELDFFGQLPGTASEAQVFASPIPRLRHAYVKLESPVVDLLVGQTWDLFGWQGMYFPSSVEAQGLPGDLYSRTPQIRVSKTVGSSAVQVDLAAAAMRPPQRDSGVPELQGGLRVAFPGWTGVTTAGMTGTSIEPFSVAVSGDVRHFVVPEFSAVSKDTVEKTTSAIAVNAFVPVIPAREDTKGNSLSLLGELVTGYGVGDLYTNFSGGGMQFPALANTTGAGAPPVYAQNVDNGMVVYDLLGGLHAMQWTSLLAGLQYYLPGADGRAWVAGNYGHMESANARYYTRPYATALPDPSLPYYVSAAQVRDSIDFFDASVVGEPVIGLRVGVEGAIFVDRYVDGARAVNQRVQLGVAWMF